MAKETSEGWGWDGVRASSERWKGSCRGGAVLLFLLIAAPLSARAQVAAPGGTGDVTTSNVRAAAIHLDVDRGADAPLAVELTFVDEEMRLWEVGGMGGLLLSNHGQMYAYLGVHRPVSLPLGLALRPSFAVGIYDKGKGRELGSALEFRSGVALERALGENLRASLFLYHLSNAGVGSRNPGLEAVGFGLSLPL